MSPVAKWRENPADVRPMLASLDEPPVAQAGLIYEPKYDGIRALVDLRPGRGKAAPPTVALYSRNGNDKTAQFPEVVRALQSVGARVDGAVAARRRDRRPRPVRPAARVSAHPGPHSPDVAGGHRARRARPADRASSCSTCCATATRTCAACRWPRVACGCRSGSSRPRASAASRD